ncbi:MAG: type 4a pilus biogenesis protein PilO [Armatimonadota bacterium]|nr:type 4a pilus biogenesis protein PilO [Armatimonadota bacterium]
MKISRREQLLIAAAVLVVAVIGLPSLKELGLGGRSDAPADLASKMTRARQATVKLRAEIAALERDVRQLTWSEPTDDLPPLILKDLHTTARQAGVTLASFRPGRVQAVPSGTRLPIMVQVRAPFPKVMAFLSRLQATNRRIALERLQIAATDTSTDTVSLEVRLAVYSTAKLTPAGGKQETASSSRTAPKEATD